MKCHMFREYTTTRRVCVPSLYATFGPQVLVVKCLQLVRVFDPCKQRIGHNVTIRIYDLASNWDQVCLVGNFIDHYTQPTQLGNFLMDALAFCGLLVTCILRTCKVVHLNAFEPKRTGKANHRPRPLLDRLSVASSASSVGHHSRWFGCWLQCICQCSLPAPDQTSELRLAKTDTS